MANYGFSALGKVTKGSNPPSLKGSKGIVYGRVVDIILDEEHPLFNSYGEYGSIGTIIFQSVSSPQPPGVETASGIRALPYFSNFKNYPLIGEIVPILFLPSIAIEQSATETLPYYLPPTNLWNNTHQNAYPAFTAKPDTQQKSYSQTQVGSVSKSSPIPTILNLGETFVEKPNIHPLQPFEGDIILEGRWGNSLRLGSTVTAKFNTWSSQGKCGDPITILKNGQDNEDDSEAWVPQIEDINRNGSSVYLTSTQAIPIETPFAEEVHSSGESSYHRFFPTPPSQYTGTQVILSGERILINAQKDHVILDAGLTLSFNAQKGFNFDTPKNFVVKTGTTIRLGKEFAPHPLVKGDKMVDLLDDLISELQKFTRLFQTVPTPGLQGVKAGATILVPKLLQIKASLPSTKSSKTFTS